MPIIGISLNFIEAKKNDVKAGEIKINSSPRIISIEETDLKPLDKKVLKIGFEFNTSYDSAGEIKLGGDMLFMHEKQKEILEHWKNAKVLSQDIAVDVFNALFSKCLLKASMIAEELQLPLPLNLPRVKPGADYIAPATDEKKKK
ncbi:MAG: hypothetical protein KKB03_02355 [Nanoarchaeota archaeon]|nr:hypothetical protein [Nanoarchaeota archaeon]MBU1135010.1 hypothetical protein [Nanoarchaeota archaeon]MBU2520061.1 hypothetical protein [Nanoarchaeota archaeon]